MSPGGHSWNYYPGTLSFSQVSATHDDRAPKDKIYRCPIIKWIADLTLWKGTRMVVPVMATRVTCPTVEGQHQLEYTATVNWTIHFGSTYLICSWAVLNHIYNTNVRHIFCMSSFATSNSLKPNNGTFNIHWKNWLRSLWLSLNLLSNRWKRVVMFSHLWKIHNGKIQTWN